MCSLLIGESLAVALAEQDLLYCSLAVGYPSFDNYLFFSISDLSEGSEKGEPFCCSVSDVNHTESQDNASDPLKEQSMTKLDLSISALAQLEPLQMCIM